MRFILNFAIFIGLISLFVNLAIKNMNEYDDTLACHSIYENSNYQEANVCYENLYKKYKSPVFKYNSALCAFYSNDFSSSKKYIDEFLIKEQKDVKLRKRVLLFLEEIYLKEKHSLPQKEYYVNLATSTTWTNPKNIKVFIEDETIKSQNFNKAFQAWDEALGDIVNFSYVLNPNEADISCSFTDEIPYSADFIGVAIVRHYKGEKNPNKKYVSNAEIKILRKSPISNSDYTDSEIYATALHEIGHALGIENHSPYMDDIMYANTESQMYQDAHLSQHDIVSVRRLYEYLF